MERTGKTILHEAAKAEGVVTEMVRDALFLARERFLASGEKGNRNPEKFGEVIKIFFNGGSHAAIGVDGISREGSFLIKAALGQNGNLDHDPVPVFFGIMKAGKVADLIFVNEPLGRKIAAHASEIRAKIRQRLGDFQKSTLD